MTWSPFSTGQTEPNWRNPLERSLPFLSTTDLSRLEAQAFSDLPGNYLKAESRQENREIFSVRLQHYYQGLEVIGSQAIYHYSKSSAVDLKLTNQLVATDISITPAVPMEEAIALTQGQGSLDLTDLPSLKIMTLKGQNQLVYLATLIDPAHPDFGGKQVFLDANSGQLLAEIPFEYPLAQSDVYSAAKLLNHPITGAPLSLDLEEMDHVVLGQQPPTPDADPSAIRANRNALDTLKYYQDVHGRDSYDNQGTGTISVVHVGHQFNNAFWSARLKFMAYGDGDGVLFGDFTLGRDVAGHEMTHAVISETSKLLYTGQSGALNEAFADFFGKMIENQNNWRVGRNIFLIKGDPKTPEAMRDLSNPATLTFKFKDESGKKVSRPYPKIVSEMLEPSGPCIKDNDYCYVHSNSTVVGHLAFLLDQKIGRQKNEKLLYAVLTQYLTSTSDFNAASVAISDACQALYDEKTCADVRDALSEVGL